jgi:tetratricopeptide (TPR) repeat protein
MLRSSAPWLVLLSALLVAAPIHTPAARGEETPQEYALRVSLETEANIHLSKGNDKFERKDYQGAIAEYDQAVEIVPYLADAYYNRSTIKATLNDREGAIEDLSWAIAVKPNHFRAYYDRAILQYEGGNRRSALEDLDRVIALRADWTEAYMHRSQIKRELGLQAEAIEDLRQAAQLFQRAGNTEAYRQVSYLISNLALKYERKIDMPKAIAREF